MEHFTLGQALLDDVHDSWSSLCGEEELKKALSDLAFIPVDGVFGTPLVF